MIKKIQKWLENEWLRAVWAGLAAFLCYFSMYAFRKPFTAGTYDGVVIGGVAFKIALVVSQVLGYMLSKFVGIKYISEMSPNRRPLSILLLIGAAEVALLLFYIVPTPYNMVCLFFNGLPLGLIWGLVFSFLEGRRQTEAMGAALAVSFIVSSGVSKSIGKILLNDYGISEFAMPALTGALFIVPLLLSVFMLAQIPPPSVSDEKMRAKRQPMNRTERRNLFRRHAVGIVALVAFYFVLTAFRDFRDNFIVEIWRDWGYTDAGILTTAEVPIAASVLVLVGAMVFIRDNARAFWVQHGVIVLSCCLILLAVFLFEKKMLSPVSLMIAVGFGLYLAYILFQSLIFERMIATFRDVGNVGFLMYLADAFGYLGSVAMLFFKNFGAKSVAWSVFFIQSSYCVAVAGIVLISFSWIYFYKKYQRESFSG